MKMVLPVSDSLGVEGEPRSFAGAAGRLGSGDWREDGVSLAPRTNYARANASRRFSRSPPGLLT